MAEIAVTVTASIASEEVAGTYCATTVSGFDHAALVDALRSRSDGKDWWMYHTLDGAVPFVSAAFTNTTGAYPTFNLTRTIAAGASDTNYRLVFGDLSRSVRILASAGLSPVGTVSTSAFTVPALALPSPGYDIPDTVTFGVRRFGVNVERTAQLHEYAEQRIRVQWRACSGEDAYTIRAVVASVRGAGTVSFLGFDYRILPNSLQWEQLSALHFNVSLELESVQ